MDKISLLNKDLYPFQSRFIELKQGTMHYIDEGTGPIMLFIHGTPTWSFLYRNFIRHFSRSYRCIAVDHLGFGLSHRGRSKGTPERHAEQLLEFVQRMNLNKITLVVHDFGGPIGIGALLQEPQRVQNIVLLNSWLWSTAENKSAQRINRLVQSSFGSFLYLYLNVSVRVLLKQGFYHKRKLSKEAYRHYLLPFKERKSRETLLELARSLVGSSSWYEEQWTNLAALQSKPWLIVWGTKDKFMSTEYLDKWCARLKNHRLIRLECGHFIQEEQPEEAIKAIEAFIQNNSAVFRNESKLKSRHLES